MSYSEAQKYWIWLASVYGLGARRFDALLDGYGPPQRIWEECVPSMERVIGPQAYGALLEARNPAYLDGLFQDMERCGAVAVTREDPEYPPLLGAIVDPPPALFVRGQRDLTDCHTISVVGARNCTAYGARMARKMARELSRVGVTVVSGLARGVDSAAHQGAVDASARTVAVLGSGVDVIYPDENKALAEKILALGGSIISELRPGSPPKSQHFPARNRMISGMCQGLLLIEAAKRSGTMTTVSFAAEQGREVFALPGQADSPLSVSTHALIRDGARLVTCAAEIIDDMGWGLPAAGTIAADTVLPTLTLSEQGVYAQLLGGPMDVDQLVTCLQISAQELNSLLTIMELQGIIRKLPGRKVERIANMED